MSNFYGIPTIPDDAPAWARIKQAPVLTTVHYSGSTVVHYGITDNNDTLPACGTRIGRYALPWNTTNPVTCRKCIAL